MFPKVSAMYAKVPAVFPKLNLAKALLAAGYTGVAVVFVSGLAYLMQISASPADAALLLTLIFFSLNALAWWFGNYARTVLSSERFGKTPLMLGDLLVILNLYALFFLYVPLLEGRIHASLSAALLAGIVYNLYWYRQPGSPRLPAPFYAYFFTFAGGALLYLTRWTLAAPPPLVLWLIIGFGSALSFLVGAWKLRTPAHFLLAIMLLFAAAVGMSASAFLARPTLGVLLAWYGVAGILCLLAWAARDLGPACRTLGFGWYGAFTLAFTASLYYLAAPPYLYVIFTAVWIGVLTMIVVALTGKEYEPFVQPAYWLSVMLGLGLVAWWGEFWSLLGHRHFRFPLSNAFALPFNVALERPLELLAPPALVVVSVAFLVSSIWQRRYPTIALSMWGYAVNQGLVAITSYLPLLLLLGLCLMFGQEAYWMALAPFVLGAGYLSLSRAEDSLFPMATLRVAGYLAIFVSALSTFYNAELATVTFAVSALIFIRHSARAVAAGASVLFDHDSWGGPAGGY